MTKDLPTMLTEQNAQYVFSFKGLGGFKAAAKLAYKASLSAGNDKKKARREAVIAFIGRKVKIRAEVIALDCNADLRNEIRKIKTKKLARRITTVEGFDATPKRGSAQNCDRVIVFRTWPGKGRSSGHTSMAIKSQEKRFLKQAGKTVVSDKSLPFSWTPDSTEKQQQRTPEMKVHKQQFASVDSRYKTDKSRMMGAKTGARLMIGNDHLEEAQERYKDKLSDIEMIQAEANPIENPTPRQKQISGDEHWGLSADKVYVPVYGKATNKVTGLPRFNMFGLDELKMRQHVHEMKGKVEAGEVFYEKNSSTEKTLELARSGGMDFFVDSQRSPLRDTVSFHDLTIELQERVDTLNNMTRELINVGNQLEDRPDRESYFHRFSNRNNKHVTEVGLKTKPFRRMRSEEVIEHLKKQLKKREESLNSEKSIDTQINHTLAVIIEKLEIIDGMRGKLFEIMPHSIILVEELNRLRELIKDEDSMRNIFLPAQIGLGHIRKMYRVDPLQ